MISDAFEDILKKSGRKPSKLWSDNGGEFVNRYFERMLKTHNIERYSVESELKAISIERFNRTLMENISKMFTERGNKRYIDEIQNIVNEYNNSYHSSIKMSPIEASKPQHEGIVYYNLYNKRRREMMKRSNKHKFKVNDIVRISKYKKHFEKGYSKRCTDELFIIYKCNQTIPETYKIKTLEKKMVIMST